MRFSIVIRSYNEERHIGRLLDGIMQQSVKDIEIILVDSGSTDGTISIAANYPVKVIIIKPDEFTFGRALNKGCSAAKGEMLVFASSHVYPSYNDWVERLVTPFRDPKIALVYGRQIGNGETKYSEHQIFSKWFPENSISSQDHPFCNNANAAILRSMWEKLPYDETLTGLEDIDWAKRTIESGYQIAYAADAEVVHVHNESPQGIYNRYRREAIALKRIFPHEHFNGLDFIRLLPANVATDCYHAYREKLLQTNFTSILMFRLMQFWGTFQGFSQRGPITSRLKRTMYYPNGRKHLDHPKIPIRRKRSINYLKTGN